jgi:CheY-like chemotaxis protein
MFDLILPAVMDKILREILLVEDSADDRDLFLRAVQTCRIPARVSVARDSIETVMRLNAADVHGVVRLPDLIVLDLGLVGLRGTTLLQVIRNAYGPRTLPVVVLTSSRDPKDRELCEAWGILDYIIKPQTYRQLETLVLSLDLMLSTVASEPIKEDDHGISSAQRYAQVRKKPVN